MQINIIAEIAGGHLGKVEAALKLVDLAHESGADTVKFQYYRAHELCHPEHADYQLFKSLEFSDADWIIIRNRIKKAGLLFYGDVFGLDSFEEAFRCDVDGYKIHTSDLDNRELLLKVASTGKTILLGIGGRKRVEVLEAIQFMKSSHEDVKIILMPGHQLFPTPPQEHWLSEIRWFSEVYKDQGITVGCSDHIDGDHPLAIYWPIAAVGAGVTVIEKHLTLDRSLKLEDFESALNPSDFSKMSQLVRGLEPSLQNYPNWSEGRESYRRKAVKVPMSKFETKVKSKLNNTNVSYLRSEITIGPLSYDLWFNRESSVPMKPFTPLSGLTVKPKVGILVNARSASTRLPKKALLKIAGKETILLLLERVKTCKTVDDIIFCTTQRADDDELASLVLKAGYKVFRGPDERVAERLLLASEKYGLDHIVRVTGDDLLRDIQLMEVAIESHLSTNADYTDMEQVVYSCSSEIISTRALRAIVNRATVPDNTEYLSWYLDDQSAFVQNILKAPEGFKRDYRLTLDTQEDFMLFEKIFTALYRTGETIRLAEVLDYLDKNPEIAEINKAITPKLNRTQLDLSLRM